VIFQASGQAGKSGQLAAFIQQVHPLAAMISPLAALRWNRNLPDAIATPRWLVEKDAEQAISARSQRELPYIPS
jgi:hypothetical protein